MPMPILIGTFTKDFFVLFPAPAWIVEFMCCVEMQVNAARDCYDGASGGAACTCAHRWTLRLHKPGDAPT